MNAGGGMWIHRAGAGGGTIACLVRRRSQPGKLFALSAAHVLAYENQGRPAKGDALFGHDDGAPLAELDDWIEFHDDFNLADAAVAGVDPSRATAAISGFGLPRGSVDYISVGDELTIVGAKSGRVSGRVSRLNFNTSWTHWNGVGWQTYDFIDHVLCDPFAHPGDSGAAVLDRFGYIVGLISGSSGDEGTVFCRIHHVLERFDAEIVTSEPGAAGAPAGAAPAPHSAPAVTATPILAPAPAAKPVAAPPGPTLTPIYGDHDRALIILTRTLWGEARGEGDEGLRAVAAVVLNRAAHPRGWGTTIETVCQMAKQFSCWNVGDPNRLPMLALDLSSSSAAPALAVAHDALAGRLVDPTSGATHYYSGQKVPEWANGKQPCYSVGGHRFFNNIP